MLEDRNSSKRRATRIDVVAHHDARIMVRPFQAKIASWNAELARLRGMALMGRGDAAGLARGKADLIAAYRTRLYEEKCAAREELAHHSVVADIDRALVRLMDEFEGLGRPTH